MNEPSTNQPNPDAPSSQDNSPISLTENEAPPNLQDGKQPKIDRTLWYTIGGFILVSCCGIILVGYLITRTSAFKKYTTFNPPVSGTPLPTPNMKATQAAWVNPGVSPTLGSADEAASAKNVYPLELFATNHPIMPDINQPGDMYDYAIELDSSHPLIWNYGWCTLTTTILDQNFNQMKVEFLLDEQAVSQPFIAVEDSQPAKDRFCRTYFILVKSWPAGEHLLETHITFLKPTNDGWNIYPAGTHTFRYFIGVRP